ncbi:MAG: PIN domain-containing protein [Bacteroidetes bacterium]|nr:PIN domain-containing protein [Bacteroidota bacterium]
MCAIVDASVVSQVFGTKRTEAGEEFFRWIDSNTNGRLVVGGKLSEELEKVSEFHRWAREAALSGKMRVINKDQVDRTEEDLRMSLVCSSNDAHVIALAQVSGARLLYSNDNKLQRDFNNKDLISNPRGKVYTTNKGRTAFSPDHRKLLARRDLCRAKA